MYKEELSVISQAILNEIEGFEFYNLAANQAETSGTKEAFLELANEELKHADYLKALWKKLSDGHEVKIEDIVESGIDIPSPEIYRWDKVDKSSSSVAMSIFGIGMQMEKSSIDFYEEAKSKLSSQASKDLIDLLISWEKVHLNQFSNQYSLLKEDWWSEQGFAPF
ncbi:MULTISPECIES: ferritin family protein [Sedimentibacter]|uniref:Ferritin family protein n=1 Tax=Sedimentibacter hydroxybenzoicus DSM 7310 TaxID=1123245 RepID=A0A974BJU1_SEDHY|nr:MULTISPECIES: ferritin family protein [Sedimentibacter]NYB74412.1 ferritin family protein [Sedimentibacter hydroxybenzoicus DSM 7310]